MTSKGECMVVEAMPESFRDLHEPLIDCKGQAKICSESWPTLADEIKIVEDVNPSGNYPEKSIFIEKCLCLPQFDDSWQGVTLVKPKLN